MRWGIIAALVLGCGVGLAQEPGFKQKIQGKWTRPNIEFGVIFKGDDAKYFSKENALKPINSGKIKFKNDCAEIVWQANGTRWLVRSAGNDVIAVESVGRRGEFSDNGYVLYRGNIPEMEFD